MVFDLIKLATLSLCALSVSSCFTWASPSLLPSPFQGRWLASRGLRSKVIAPIAVISAQSIESYPSVTPSYQSSQGLKKKDIALALRTWEMAIGKK